MIMKSLMKGKVYVAKIAAEATFLYLCLVLTLIFCLSYAALLNARNVLFIPSALGC